MDDPQVLLQRRRLWGVPPDAVMALMTRCKQDHADLRAQMATLEDRLARAQADAQAERATLTTEGDTLRERIAALEQERAEWKGRPEMLRAEAVQFVVDAYAEAQAARAQSEAEIAAAREAADAEAAAEREQARAAIAAERAAADAEMATQRESLAAERQRLEADVAALRQQQAEAVTTLDTLGRSLLAQFGRGDAPALTDASPMDDAPETATETAPDAALETLFADDANHAETRDDDTGDPPPAEPSDLDTVSAESPDAPDATAAPPEPEDVVVSSEPHVPSSEPKRAAPSEDAMLARALDELEAILKGSRKENHENGDTMVAS